ncbi:MAG: hypothetical protein IJ677_02540 [Alphaproteobacteria bacterium]|nr:hypothetical protein [Alphaproteobacteria bacterium]
MNKYILMLGVAGVVLGSYAAYAGNSATMTVTATIAHDVSLSVTQDLDLGTITINPAYTGTDTHWTYSESGVRNYTTQGAVVSAPDITVGTFTANLPDPSACDGSGNGCIFTSGYLTVDGNDGEDIYGFFGGEGDSNGCKFRVKFSGTGNTYKIVPVQCWIADVSTVTHGNHSGTLTIYYSA